MNFITIAGGDKIKLRGEDATQSEILNSLMTKPGFNNFCQSQYPFPFFIPQ